MKEIRFKNIKTLLPRRKRDVHKGDCGKVCCISGSRGMLGSAYLVSQAALSMGSGLVYLLLPDELISPMSTKAIEIILKGLPGTNKGALDKKASKSILDIKNDIDVFAIGPGLTDTHHIKAIVEASLKKIIAPIVLDADGINAIAGNTKILLSHKHLVLTPHPVEFARLFNVNLNVVKKSREKIVLKYAKQFKTVIVLKGYETLVADQRGNLYRNKTGNSGMATAGSGDVLTGIIASLIGQGKNIFDAACLGTYLHGLAGDLALKDKTKYCVLATDLIKYLPNAIKLTLSQ